MYSRSCLFAGRGRLHRRGIALMFVTVLLVVLMALVALAVDIGYVVLTRTQLQVAADAAALAGSAYTGQSREAVIAAARKFASYHIAAGQPVQILDSDVEFGTWDAATRVFTPTGILGNAIRVTARRDAAHGGSPGLFFGRVLGQFQFTSRASAVAMANPRDIAFVVDLSGSMNDDTEPCWATGEITKVFGPQGYPTVGADLVAQLFADLGYGAYPGRLEWFGQPFGVPQTKYAYAELTKDGGPLTARGIPDRYRILPGDSELVRKRKAYSAVIDYQIAALMPRAKPVPDSNVNYDYWEKYLDYILEPVTVRGVPKKKPPREPIERPPREPQPPRGKKDTPGGSSGGGKSGQSNGNSGNGQQKDYGGSKDSGGGGGRGGGRGGEGGGGGGGGGGSSPPLGLYPMPSGALSLGSGHAASQLASRDIDLIAPLGLPVNVAAARPIWFFGPLVFSGPVVAPLRLTEGDGPVDGPRRPPETVPPSPTAPRLGVPRVSQPSMPATSGSTPTVSPSAPVSTPGRAIDLPIDLPTLPRPIVTPPVVTPPRVVTPPPVQPPVISPPVRPPVPPGSGNRGTLPPNQDPDRITGFNNPNPSTFPSASKSVPASYRNRLGYLTYVQFMLDFGRDLKPDDRTYVPLSPLSPLCPYHSEDTAGGSFRFPPRTQPVHAARRALIAAIQVVRERNAGLDPAQSDWVSVISFDSLTGGGPVVQQELTADYQAAMEACTRLEAVGDKAATTATEAGLIAARKHIQARSAGGQGRESANKVVVLLTDGVPNLYVSSRSEIDAFIRDNPRTEFYGDGRYWCDAPLMQTLKMQAAGWQVFPVGVGLGTDYGFMDRLARLGGTADDNGQSARGSGNPAEYEQRLTEIFKKIITSPRVRLVQ